VRLHAHEAEVLLYNTFCITGGGAFLLAFVISGFLIGIPLCLLESAFAQFSSLGPLEIWRVSPIFKGLGFAMITILWVVDTYYCVTMAHIFYYLFASMTAELPWSTCGNSWNTEKCYCAVCPVDPNNTSPVPTNPNTPAEEFYE
jgi:SNF family Na+-dependent transporter